MATITYFTDGLVQTVDLSHRVIKQENVIDFSKANATTAGDTVNLLKIPAGAHVLQVGVDVITPEGSPLTMTIGDTVGTEWISVGGAGIDLGTSPVTVPTYFSIGTGGSADTNAAAGGKLYTSDTTLIGVLSAAAAVTAKFTVWAKYAMITNLT